MLLYIFKASQVTACMCSDVYIQIRGPLQSAERDEWFTSFYMEICIMIWSISQMLSEFTEAVWHPQHPVANVFIIIWEIIISKCGLLSLREAWADDEEAGASLLWGKAERGGTVQPEAEKAWGDLINVYKYLKKGYKEDRARIFLEVTGDRGSGQKLKQKIPHEHQESIFLYSGPLLGSPAWAERLERLEKMIFRGV